MEDRRAHERINDIEERLATFEGELRKNTTATQEIAANTAEIVTLIKGAKILRGLILSLASIAAAFLAIFAFFKDHWK